VASIALSDFVYVRSSLTEKQAWSAVYKLPLYPTFREMTVDRGVVGGGDGYSAGGAGSNDSITLVVVAR